MLKRSDINRSIAEAVEFFKKMNFPLPAFAGWSPQEWAQKGPECQEIRYLGLGWDVTDFGSGEFNKIGRTIFTLRNGSNQNPTYPKSYAQKAMYMPENQRSVIHYHRNKREDIFNQGGGTVLIRLWATTSDNKLAEKPLFLSLSGLKIEVPAGEIVRIEPGESLCVPPFTFHQFWTKPGNGPALSVEISSICDDHTDNIFLENGERFPQILEDEPRQWMLCQEYVPSTVRDTSIADNTK